MAKSKDELAEWVYSKPGMGLVIMNTPESAAVIADDMKKKYGPANVVYLSETMVMNSETDQLSFWNTGIIN